MTNNDEQSDGFVLSPWLGFAGLYLSILLYTLIVPALSKAGLPVLVSIAAVLVGVFGWALVGHEESSPENSVKESEPEFSKAEEPEK